MRAGCGDTYVSFSKVTVALCGLDAASETGVTDSEVIFPLDEGLDLEKLSGGQKGMEMYQKLKKSRTSFSVVW